MEDLYRKACAHFDDGEYFEAHEVWEDLWNEASGARHAYLQGLIQVAVALHHAGTGNFKGTRKLLGSALGYLEKAKDSEGDVDLDKLRDLMLDFELTLQEKLAGKEVTLPYFKLPYK